MRALLSLFAVFCAAGAVASCSSSPDTNLRTQTAQADLTNFGPVARVFQAKCGTLDCHGNTHRNFRLYGYGGHRLPAEDGGVIIPDEIDITQPEIEADFHAAVGVEPEKMNAVIADHGAFPERLTLVRKARGTEDHKGLNPVIEGDGADRCILSWLASNVDSATCLATSPPISKATSR